ncbi:cupredoxin domain-containing protein [Spongiibacter sp. KMU-158]|uniref:Cupredoxin domain-containing protein n=2 Tax=Spongiibacter pelagi TaxID=2760804 RepID=A0A927GVF7_9GAMM|nr:cupredoxin domain-containing protein [Spongiibacter pelagi]
MPCKSNKLHTLFLLSLLMIMGSSAAYAGKPVFELQIRNHLFEPSTLSIPANTKIKLLVHNTDKTPEEFESYELNREKVILGGQKAVIFIGPLPPGKYPFFGEFNPKTAQGEIIAE